MRRAASKFFALEDEQVVVDPNAPVIPVESVNPAEPAEEIVVVDIGDNADSLETDMIEIGETVADQDIVEDKIDDAGEVIEALEGIAEILTVAAANGGMNQHAMEAISISTAYLYKRAGFTAKPMPAMESFATTSGRIEGTKAALEDVKETLSKIWDAIMSGIKKSIEWAHDFYMRIILAFDKVGKRAKDLSAKAKSLENKASSEPKENIIKNERLAKALSKDGKPFPDAKYIELIADILPKGTFSYFCEAYHVFMEAAKGDGWDTTFIDNSSIKANLVNNDQHLKIVSNPESIGYEKPDTEGISLYRGVELPGGKAIVAYLTNKDAKGEEAVRLFEKLSAGINDFDKKKTTHVSEEIAVIEYSKLESLLGAVEKICEHASHLKEVADELMDDKKEILAHADKCAKLVKDIDSGDVEATTNNRKNISAYQRVTKKYASLNDQPIASILQYTLYTCKAVEDYAEECLKQYA